jgi:hypothetical protein
MHATHLHYVSTVTHEMHTRAAGLESFKHICLGIERFLLTSDHTTFPSMEHFDFRTLLPTSMTSVGMPGREGGAGTDAVRTWGSRTPPSRSPPEPPPQPVPAPLPGPLSSDTHHTSPWLTGSWDRSPGGSTCTMIACARSDRSLRAPSLSPAGSYSPRAARNRNSGRLVDPGDRSDIT